MINYTCLELMLCHALFFYAVCYIVVVHAYLSNINHDYYPTYLRKDLKHYLIIANMPPEYGRDRDQYEVCRSKG